MRLVIGLLSLLPLLAAAETGYVTDRLMLGLHQAADTSDRPFRSLESGTEFEILSRDRLYAHVRLADGTEGYVKAAYVVYEPPAKLIVNQAFENQGLNSTRLLGSVIDGLMRNTPEAKEFIDFAEKAGVPAAVARRDGLFGDYSQAPADQKPNPKNAYPAPEAKAS